MRDFFRLLGASFGWVKDIGADVGIRYYEFLKHAAWASAIIFLVAVVLFFLSETFDLAAFNTLGMLIMASLMVFWVLASQPVVALGEQLVKIGPIRRITQRVGTGLLLSFVLTLYSLYVPAGTDGLAQIGILAILLMGALFLGLQLTRRTIGVKLIILGSLLAAAVYFPQTISKIPAIRQVVDRSIINKVMPGAGELDISLAQLEGEGSKSSRLFLDGDPLWWCRRSPERTAGFRCFDQPGNDQITNEQLVPISQEIVLEMKNRLAAEKLRLDAEEVIRTADLQETERQKRLTQTLEQAAAAKRAETDRIQQLEAERKLYIQRYVLAKNSSVEVGLGFKQGASLNRRISQQLGNLLKVSSDPQFLSDLAVSDGVFDRLFNGNMGETTKLRLDQVAGRIVLGTLDVDFKDNDSIRGMVNATVALDARIFETRTGVMVDGFHHDATAIGYSQTEAQKNAEDQLVVKIAQWVDTK